MARLTAQQWEQAREDYEVRGLSLGEVARRYGINVSNVSRKAKTQDWHQTQCQMQDLVSRNVKAAKEIALIEAEKARLPEKYRKALDDEVRSQLELEGIRRTFHCELYDKGRALLRDVTTVNDWKTLTSGARDLMPQDKSGTTVNVSQQQAQGQRQAMTPLEAMKEAVAMERESREKNA